MTKTEFLSFIEHPENIGSVSLSESEKVLSKFPYWQSARLIFVKALQQQQHFSYDSQLKLAAIYAGNRSRLFELINKVEGDGERESGSNINHEDHFEQIQKVIKDETESSQLEVGNATIESESDLIPIEKIEEPFLIEEPTETTDENIIAIENSSFENTEILTDEKEEDFNKSENDLSKIIEQRIKELTEQNSSYSQTENQDSITENTFENTASLTDENIPALIGNNLSDKSSFEDEAVSIEEEMAAIDVYEETAIADDVFNSDSAEVVSTPETIVEILNESNDDAKTDSSQHSFLDWFRFLKPGEVESGSSINIEQSKVDNEIIEDDSIVPTEENSTSESATPIIVSEESEIKAETSNDEQKTSIEIESEIRNPKPETSIQKPETSNLIDKFIEEDPRIQPKKSAFFSPSVAARKSVEYDDEVVSETLAEIFYKQQLYDKAMKAYEKLTLMFPEKSTLFAARIKKIKEESKSGK